MNLNTKHAPQIINMLERALADGEYWVVFEMLPQEMDLQPYQLKFFETKDEALDHWEGEAGLGYMPMERDTPVYYRSTQQLLEEIKQANTLIKTETMNRNNLENLKGELKALGFDDKIIKDMEANMEKNLPNFQLKTQLPADRGQIDVSLHFRQSGQSDYYYFNRYDLAWSKAKPLENDQKYIVISPGNDNKNRMKKFDSPVEAIEFFKSQKGASELAIGKATGNDLPFKNTLATMKEGKVDYVAKDFQKEYYSPSIVNHFYVEKGAGFPVNQAANLLQGRSVYREDLVNRAGEQYKAWSTFLFDKPKDKYGNYEVKQFSEGWGYDVKKALEEYKIKMDADPKKQEQLVTDLKNGNRPVVTVEGKDGKDIKLRIEAVPRYGNLNFYQVTNGAPEKREDFLKVPKPEKTQANAKEQVHGQEMGV